jgi:hypothetical protein
MGHRLDRGDVIDLLEESITLKLPVAIELSDGRKFEDRVTDISKLEGEDHVEFALHELTPLRHISKADRAYPIAHSYAGKR